MREGWNESNLSELYEFSSGLSKGRKYFGTGYPFLTYKEIFNNIFAPKILKSLVETSKKEREKHSIMRGDVFLTRTSETVEEIGISCVAIKDYPNATFNGFAKRLRPKTGKILPEYAGYYFRNRQFQQMASSLCTLITRASLNNNDLSYLSIYYPSINHQRKIASILSPYDNLIENNTRRIKILEEMAQRIYREWFVHFRFPGHEKVKMVESELGIIPEGWKVGILDDVATFSNGFAFKSKEILKKNTGNCYHIFKMGQIVKGGGFDSTKTKSYIEKEKCKNLEKYLLKTGDLLMCMTDMKANVALLGHTALMNEDDKYLLNQRVGLIRANNDINIDCPYLYLLTNSSLFIDDIRSRANSGVQVNLSTTEIKKTRILMPPRTINEKFDILGKSIFQLISLYQFKNENLRQTSELLLPKLISGKINVEDLDIEIPDDVAETSNNILADSQLIEENNCKQPDSISIKTDEKKPSKEKVDTSEAVRVPLIEEFDINQMMAAFRQVCRSRGIMDREELLKEVSLFLGYKRLGYTIKEVLRGHLRAAIRRKIIGTSGSDVCIKTPTMDTYKQEELIDTLCSVMRKDREYERDDVIREVANHLGFKKMRDTVITPIKSAINGAIRRGILDYEGPRIWRES